MTFTHYIIQVLEEGFPKNVPHTGKNNCEFLDRKQAVEFKERLVQNNPNDKLIIMTTFKKHKLVVLDTHQSMLVFLPAEKKYQVVNNTCGTSSKGWIKTN